MDRTSIIKEIMENQELRVSDVARKSGLPYTSVKSILDRGVEKSSYINICKICESIGITADELERMSKNDETDSPIIMPRKINTQSDKRLQKIIDCYNKMDEIGKNSLLEQAEFLESKHIKTETKAM